MTVTSATPLDQKTFVAAIVRAALIEAALIAVGVALFFVTGQVVWLVGAFVAGAGVMFGLVILPQMRRQIAAAKAAKGPTIVE